MLRVKLQFELVSFLIVLLFFVYGCATIMHGTKQQLGISSNPTSADVTIDGQIFGKTPLTAELSRKDNHLVKIELEGYLPYETNLTRKTSGWVWGNILFGGLIGLAVDAISGGMYKLTPEQIQAELKNANIASVKNDDYLFITVVLSPDPTWEKIGNLEIVDNR